METKIYIVKFNVHGINSKCAYLVRCQTSAYAIQSALCSLVKAFETPSIKSVFVQELEVTDETCELPY